MHGWFSQKQAKNILNTNEKNPYKVYLNDKNKEVIVTCVTESMEKNYCNNFNDMEYVGVVVKYLRKL
mgnify:CR=1 FL=1